MKPLPEVPELSIYEFLTRAAKKHPQKAAFISFGKITTYQELDEFSNRFANALIAMGIQKNDRVIEKYKVTVAHIPPTGFIGLLNHPDFERYDLSSLWYCACGGSPLPPALIKAWKEKTGVRLLDAYGCTETSGTAPGTVETPVKNREGSAGTTHFELKVVDQEGRIVPRGTIGEVLHRGPGIALGYWNKPEETKEAFTEDGWWLSGDAGYMDEDDFIYVVDRYKDLVVTSGFNVAPADVEKVIYTHEAVQEVCVYGVPDAYRVEAVKAAIVLKDVFKGKVTEQEIIDFCRANMAVYKAPRFVDFVTEIPKTTSGKTLRRLLREKDAQKVVSL
jgi:long-chain acyl-CoA synthetase